MQLLQRYNRGLGEVTQPQSEDEVHSTVQLDKDQQKEREMLRVLSHTLLGRHSSHGNKGG